MTDKEENICRVSRQLRWHW